MDIKLDKAAKQQLQSNLTKLDTTISRNISNLSYLCELITMLSGNPEIYNIIANTCSINDNKMIVKNYVLEYKRKTDLSLEQIVSLDEELSNKFGGW